MSLILIGGELASFLSFSVRSGLEEPEAAGLLAGLDEPNKVFLPVLDFS